MANNFIVSDNYIEEAVDFLCDYAALYESVINSFAQIIKEDAIEGIKQGKTSDALVEFSERITSCLAGKMESIGVSDTAIRAAAFLSEVDDTDEKFY